MRAVRGRRALVGAVCAVVVAGVATAVVLVTTAHSSSEPTRAQYLAGVAAICRVFGPKLDVIRPPDVAEPANVIAAVDQVLPLVQAQLRQVRGLTPPPSLRPRVDRWLVLQARRVGMLEKAQVAGQRQDFRAMSIAYVDFLLAGSKTSGLGRSIGIPHPPC
jgi:hypothetical protein